MAWLRVLAVVGIYLVVAAAASLVVRRVGGELREMEGRTSGTVLAVGAVANLVVLGATLLFLVAVDDRPIAALGLGFGTRDLAFTATALVLTACSAAAFLATLRAAAGVSVRLSGLPRGGAGKLASSSAVLLIVALQEEVLYRGYVTVNLIVYGAAPVLVAGTLIFTLIHFLTNRVSAPQVASWLVGGLMLGAVYLVTGSLWVVVILHLAMDLTNVLAFGIAGDLALVRLSAPITVRQRMAYRVVSSVVVVAALVAFYGLRLAAQWR